MAKKQKQIEQPIEEPVVKKVPTAVYKVMPHAGPVPVRPASSSVQLTPIVQPIAFVPYSTQEQPLLIAENEEYSDDCNYENQRLYEDETEEEIKGQKVKSKKSINFISIILIVLAILTAAVVVMGKFVDSVAEYTSLIIQDEEYLTGFALIERVFESFKAEEFSMGDIFVGGNLIGVLALASGAFAILVLITSLFRLKKSGTSIITKIIAALCAACTIAALIVAIMSKEFEMAIGLYIMVGLGVVIALLAIIARKEKISN